MGFDPMTHRPRTDIFSSLPHLIALANLKDLIDQHSWEEQTARLQSEANQIATIQYLQYLLQPNHAPPSVSNHALLLSNNSTTSSTVTHTEETLINLLNINESTNVIPFLETPVVHESSPFTHMPDLESTPCNNVFNKTSLNKEEVILMADDHHQISNNFSFSPSLPADHPNSTGDACSTTSTSYGGAAQTSFWSDLLLEDPLFNEIIIS